MPSTSPSPTSGKNDTLRATVYLAVSVDGYIADADGGVGWLDDVEHDEADGDMGYSALIESVDAIVMGRKSYETVRGFDVPWPYEIPVIVVSTSTVDIPDELAASVRHLNHSAEELATVLPSQGIMRVYVDGGDTVRRFLRAGLVDRMTLTQIPVLLGTGISLFEGLGQKIPLTFESSTPYSSGLVQTTYTVSAGAAPSTPTGRPK